MSIKHELINPHSSQSNDKAERLNRILNEYVRAMLFQANMSKSFWTEVMTIAVYLINQLSSDIVDVISYELWYNKSLISQDLKSLRSFDYITYVHISE